MASVTNKTTSTATPDNKVVASSNTTWDEATFTWDEGAGTFDNPYSLDNKVANPASITNKGIE